MAAARPRWFRTLGGRAGLRRGPPMREQPVAGMWALSLLHDHAGGHASRCAPCRPRGSVDRCGRRTRPRPGRGIGARCRSRPNPGRRGRRPAHRTGGQRVAEGAGGAGRPHGLRAVRALGRGRAADSALPLPDRAPAGSRGCLGGCSPGARRRRAGSGGLRRAGGAGPRREGPLARRGRGGEAAPGRGAQAARAAALPGGVPGSCR